jgi:molecular chaperone GrpE (heat shock protein)
VLNGVLFFGKFSHRREKKMGKKKKKKTKQNKKKFLLGLQLVWYQFMDILVGLGIRCLKTIHTKFGIGIGYF